MVGRSFTACSRERGIQRVARLVDEARDRGDRQRDVVLDVRAFPPLRFGDIFTQRPQCVRLLHRLRDRRVECNARFERGAGGGSKLGLTIAQHVAIAHGRSVTIAASPLGKARVVLTLAPVTQDDGQSSSVS